MQYSRSQGAAECDSLAFWPSNAVINSLETVVRLY